MLLHSLSDDQIISRVHRLARRERTATLLVLLHLNEIERRQLHLALGCPSLFGFCTKRLGYSESDAGRRIAAARCVARFPEVYGLLEANAVTVVTIARVASILTPENKAELLGRIRGRTQDEVDAIVAEVRPREAGPRDRVQVIACRPMTHPQTTPLLAATTAVPEATESAESAEVAPSVLHTAAPAGACEMPNDSHSGSECKERTETRLKFTFSADKEFKVKFDRVRSLASHRLPTNASCEDVFELLLDEFLEREDPRRRQERREKRTAVKERKTRAASTNPRHIPASVRDEVFQRDDGRCTFVGRDGQRCGSTHLLQLDHIRPVALGGEGTRDNLRLLCARHNRWEAERMLGRSRDENCSARVAVSGCPPARDYWCRCAAGPSAAGC